MRMSSGFLSIVGNAEAAVASLARPRSTCSAKQIVLTYSQGDEVITTGSEEENII